MLVQLAMKSYRDLDIYKESKQLAIGIHKITMTLPKFEIYEEGSQLRRSSKAITSSIVEGYGHRRYKVDFIRYLIYSQAECDETILHRDFLFETNSLSDQEIYQQLKSDYILLSMKINSFTKYVVENWNDNSEHETSNK